MNTQELPNAKEVEASIISALLTVPNSIYNCLQLLNEDCFYHTKHRILWKAIIALHKKEEKIDIINVSEYLKERKQLETAGGLNFIVELTGRYFTSDVTGYSKILYQKYMRRNAIIEAQRLIRDSYNPSTDIFSVLNQSKSNLFDCLTPQVSKTRTAKEAILSELAVIQDNLGKFQEVTGVPSGFMNVDKRTGGLEGGLFYVVGGRPSMGKTTYVLNLAWNAYESFNHSGMFFSLEMSEKQISRKLMSKMSGIPSDDFKKNKVSEFVLDDLYDRMSSTEDKVFLIDDTPNASLQYILSQATKAKLKHDIKFIVIDYLQLIKVSSTQSRHLQVSEISRELKALARNLDIAVIALAQLSRNVENRPDKRPKLADLKESGDIEQDADAVCFLYRPEYYGITQDEQGNSLEGVTELIWRKVREGEIGIDFLTMDKAGCSFSELCLKTGYEVTVEEYDRNLIQMQDINFNFKNKLEENEGMPF